MTEIKRKILIYSPGIYPCTIGGMEVFYYYFANELAKTKSLIVATLCKENSNPSIEIMNLQNRLFIVRRFGFSQISLIVSGFFQLARRRRHIGIIHIPCTSSLRSLGILFVLAKKILKISYIIYIHGGGMRPWRIKIFYRAFFENADRIVAVSEIIKNEYEKRTGRKIQVVLPLIPFSRSVNDKKDLKRDFGLHADDKVILVVGSLKPLKGSEIILKSFMNLGIEFVRKEKLKLIFAGDGKLRKTLEAKVFENQEYVDHVCFLGNLPQNKLPDAYAIANIYVIASWFEGTPKSLLEAMYNGLPIIGSNVNGINNIIVDRQNGLLFKKNSDIELKEKLVYLMENNDFAHDIGENAKADYNLKYSFLRTVESFKGIYDFYLANK